MTKIISGGLTALLLCLGASCYALSPDLSDPPKNATDSSASKIDRILVNTDCQKLYTLNIKGDTLDIYPCSTSKYGIGNQLGSNKTPLGVHRIADKRGDGKPLGAIFKAKIYTGQEAEIVQSPVSTGKDYVTTRIMHLEGTEPGVNKGEGIDSYRRYIYIHGTPEEGLIGKPASHGCVRMKNEDVVKLYDQVSVGTIVEII